MRKLFFVLGLFVFSGCTVTKPVLDVHVEPGPSYDILYPYYVELVAVSQLKPIGQEPGGRHGHAAIFLKGVCRDESAEYPQIKICDEKTTDLTNPESGVGVSVDKMFKTVNWVAVPGRKLFYQGDLEPGQVLNQSRFDATILKVQKLGLFKGIQFHEEFLKKKPGNMSGEAFVARESIGTDYALQFGRSVFCTRLPVTRAMMEKTVAFLNALNRKYAGTEMPYEWSGYSDNCAHTVHNALAAAGVWKSKKVKTFSWRFLANVAVPANEFAELAFLADLYPLENAGKIRRNKIMKQSLIENKWLPMRHGALVSVMPIHTPNELYSEEFTAYMLDGPLRKKNRRKIREMVADKRYTDVRENLNYFRERYTKTIVAECADGAGCLVTENEKESFQRNYCGYLKTQWEDIEAKLKKLTNEGNA